MFKEWTLLKKLIWLKGAILSGASAAYATVSGAVVSFITTRSAPLKQLVVDVDPVQSGSGDPSPDNVRPISGWTGCEIGVDDYYHRLIPTGSWSADHVIETISGVQLVYLGSGKYRLNGTATANGTFTRISVVPFETLSTSAAGRKVKFNNNVAQANTAINFYSGSTLLDNYTFSPVNRGGSYSSIASKTVDGFSIYIQGGITYNNFDFMIEFVESPIECHAIYFGKNIYNGKFLSGYWAFANGTFASSTKWICTEMIPCRPNTDYVASWSNGYTTRFQGFVWFDSAGGFISATSWNTAATDGKAAKSPAESAFFGYNIAGTTTSMDISASDLANFQIEIGTAKTAYEAPNTVYGGTLTIKEDGSGVLKSRPYYASYNGETLVGPWVSSMDKYVSGATPTTGAQVVDLGGTETSTNLTPGQVTALLGQNYLWADTGNVSVTYYYPGTTASPIVGVGTVNNMVI